jgi:hypothetical protein
MNPQTSHIPPSNHVPPQAPGDLMPHELAVREALLTEEVAVPEAMLAGVFSALDATGVERLSSGEGGSARGAKSWVLGAALVVGLGWTFWPTSPSPREGEAPVATDEVSTQVGAETDATPSVEAAVTSQEAAATLQGTEGEVDEVATEAADPTDPATDLVPHEDAESWTNRPQPARLEVLGGRSVEGVNGAASAPGLQTSEGQAATERLPASIEVKQ